MPRISVLMPTHNRDDVVGYAIRSVLAQTEGDFELLVVGDGCTDRTADVVAGFDDRRIRWFDLPKAPHFGYANRNIALRQAKGDLIAFAAHDDLLFPDHLELLTKAIEDAGAEWIYSRPLWVSTDGIVVPFCTNLDNADELEQFLTQRNTIPASCVMHRACVFERSGYWPEDVTVAGDWHFWKRIISDGNRESLAYLKTPTTLHFSADWKQSRHSYSREVKAMFEIMEQINWWPASLRHDIPEGTAEQAVVWNAMQTGGARWAAQVRTDIEATIDRIAWDALQRQHPVKQQQAAEIGRLEEALERAQGDAARNEEELARIRNSLSWRILEPFRRFQSGKDGP